MKFKRESERLYSKLEQEEKDGKIIYFKKRRVYPPLNRDGTISWKYFLIGNWKTFIVIVLIVLITLGFLWEYSTNLKIGADCLAREQAKNITNLFP